MPDKAGDWGYAHQTGVNTIYKFRPYRTAEQREQLEDIVLGHRVYFARFGRACLARLVFEFGRRPPASE